MKKEYPYEQKIAFIKSLYCPARAVAAQTGCSWELILAQAAQETGWGEKTLPGTNNIFNIKASPGWHGESRVFRVWEKVRGEKIWVNAPFRVYPDIAASLRDRTEFLKSNPIYTKAGLFDPGTVGDFVKEAKALKKAGYATDEKYVQLLQDVWNGRTMRRAVAEAQKQGCGLQLPVVEIFIKDAAKVAIANTKLSVTVSGRISETMTDAHGSIAVRIAPNMSGAIALKVFDSATKDWVALDPVSIPNPVKSLTVTLLAPTIRIQTSTRVHDKPPKPPAAAPAAKPATPAPAQHGKPKTKTYTVRKGDTLGSIAAAEKMRYKTIADLNNIKSPYIIRPDQVLLIPILDGAHGAAPAHPPAAQPRAAHPPAAHPPATKPASPAPAPAAKGSMFGDLIAELHTAYLRDAADKPKTAVAASLKAPWMKIAEEEFKAKVKRVTGAGANSHIIDYFKATDLNKKDASTDETAWCAAFCNWCLVKSGFAGDNSAWAANFKKWGRPTRNNKPAFGAVALIRFKSGKHHVTFVAGLSKDGSRLATLGGNQGDFSAVTHSHVPADWVVCYRYPSDYPDYDDDYVLHDVKADGAPLTSASTHS
ncbi:TIGR02594 family protein [Pseudoduganella armeniaca]|uniref:Peptidoglycan hydrolase n=1 Tax=Pseudoduganella armeniaca TaxID=2072590 RepID=A0A2R4C7N0_9BURK|nr:TIGR02594 family protein [Pseudoduganella armeniaca]AVR95637.1 flagellar biosynthesis protein FlgJ [Pseudoduganella armeniaca]